ncbi:hypothetical protein OUZ56_020680 [Daphnia magna]|uniref:Uncharacterized protein n=1 Tax=Daphnia magna TaxID=35525 RepID=A0ABQ9ZF49_9CRUS|nr:hypothetical protein OUZ56_020680 [Daphnia magna]
MIKGIVPAILNKTEETLRIAAPTHQTASSNTVIQVSLSMYCKPARWFLIIDCFTTLDGKVVSLHLNSFLQSGNDYIIRSLKMRDDAAFWKTAITF